MTTLNTQLCINNEVTYGTSLLTGSPRFYEYESEDVQPVNGRIESPAMRAGMLVQRADRTEPDLTAGAAGPIVLPVPTKGFGLALSHCMGTSSIGSVIDANQEQTHAMGPLLGDFFTCQINRPFNPAGTNQAFTFAGGKITDFTISCEVGGFVMADLSCDFASQSTSPALASATYASDFRFFPFTGVTATVDSVNLEIRSFSVSVSNALKTDNRYLGVATKKEPVQDGMRTIEWSISCDFSNLTQYNRAVSATRAGMLAPIVISCLGPVAHGGTTLPRLQLSIPAARFDDAATNVGGPEALTLDLSGVGLWDGTNSPLTILYRTSDTAI